jgi:glutathione peroxidase
MSIYAFKAITIDGEEVSLEQYKGKVLIIANTASKCGFTPQYEGLEKLYEQYKDKGFEILGFPSNQFAGQEPGQSNEIKDFCTINYGVSFQLFEKNDVRGENAQHLFKYLTEKVPFKGFDLNKTNESKFNDFLKESFPELLDGNSIKWNFTKFLIGRDGNIAGRYEPTTEPLAMTSDIDKLIEQSIDTTPVNENLNDDGAPYIGEHGEDGLKAEDPFDLVYNNIKTQNM